MFTRKRPAIAQPSEPRLLARPRRSVFNNAFGTYIALVDTFLDDNVAPAYKRQPLAQDWARVAKAAEEAGEAVSELILLSGQNPRKPADPAARARLLKELGDTAFAAILAIQHFTKDATETEEVLNEALSKAVNRALGTEK